MEMIWISSCCPRAPTVLLCWCSLPGIDAFDLSFTRVCPAAPTPVPGTWPLGGSWKLRRRPFRPQSPLLHCFGLIHVIHPRICCGLCVLRTSQWIRLGDSGAAWSTAEGMANGSGLLPPSQDRCLFCFSKEWKFGPVGVGWRPFDLLSLVPFPPPTSSPPHL